jgi:hypothetical protein
MVTILYGVRTKNSKISCPCAVVTHRSPWRVAVVEALPHFPLKVRFFDSTEGIVDMSGVGAVAGCRRVRCLGRSTAFR